MGSVAVVAASGR
jgi:hypothetical protein